ncbi:K Homology domain-containing protein [Entamoeba marina]
MSEPRRDHYPNRHHNKNDEKKPRKKWDVVNHDFLKMLKEQGQNISVAITDPTQALITVPQRVALATIGTSDFDAFLAQQKKGTHEYSENICINHLDGSLRSRLLKSYTHELLLKEYNIHVSVGGVHQPDFHGTEFNPDDATSYVNKCGQSPLYLLVKGSTPKELKSGLDAIKEMFEGHLKIEIYPPDCQGNEESFAEKIIGKNRVNIKFIEKKSSADVFLKGRGSTEDYNDSNLPLHFILASQVPVNLLKAKRYCNDLITHVKKEWEKQQQKQAMQK